jgi:hypothetical protein
LLISRLAISSPVVCVASGVSEAAPAGAFLPLTSIVSRSVEPAVPLSCAPAGPAAQTAAKAVHARSIERECQTFMSVTFSVSGRAKGFGEAKSPAACQIASK